MRKAKNLKVIAEKVLQRSLAKRTWHPNTRDLSIQYDLDETQVATVKQYVKKQAADLGVLWGWDPSIKGFRVAPDQDNKVAREMLAFAFDSWANAGKSIRYQVRGAQGQGFVTPDSASVAQKGLRGVETRIRRTYDRLEFTSEGDLETSSA